MQTPMEKTESGRAPERRGALGCSPVELLVSLGVLMVTSPFVEDLPRGNVIEASLLSMVMVFAVLAVGGGRRSLTIALVLLAPALVGKWINHFFPNLLHPAFFLAAVGLFFGFVVARLLVFLVREPRVDANVLCAGVSGFLLLGLLWMPAYAAIARMDPHAFALPTSPGAPATLDGFSAFYFSFITLCTVGYGDIAPVSRVARMLAVTEAVAGLFYMAVLISRLVSLHSSAQSAARNSANLSGKN